MNTFKFVLLAGFGGLFLMSSLSCERNMTIDNLSMALDRFQEIHLNQLLKLKILFGHASVGNNIVQGLEKIKHNDRTLKYFNVVRADELTSIDENGLHHFILRKNGDPQRKIKHFKDTLTGNNLGDQIDVAILKLCYVDIESDTDIDAVFKAYTETVAAIKRQYPDLKIVHVTVPLYTHRRGFKGYIKRILKPDLNNVNRHRYNQLIKKKFQGSDSLFDLARLESTYPDGSRASFMHRGDTFYHLANLYTDDGGHLNELGQFLAAKELLRVLVETTTP